MSLAPEKINKVHKSFVLRKGRITKAQRRALKNLKSNYMIPVDKKSLDFSKSFQDSKEKLIADVGFGSGESALYLAENYKNANVVGIEVYPSGIGATLNKIHTQGLTNLKLIEYNFQNLLTENIKGEVFDLVVFLYPDPWPKRRHHKRRLFNKGFLNLLHERMNSEGLIYCKTDCKDYYVDIKKEFSIHEGWVKQGLNKLPKILKFLPLSNYEKKAIKGNRQSKELFFKKVSN